MNQTINKTSSTQINPAERIRVSEQPVSGRIANEIVIDEVSSWSGMVLQEHAMGGIEFRYDNKNFGHLHDPPGTVATADVILPKDLLDRLVALGRAHNHITDKNGISKWATITMKTMYDVMFVIKLLRLKYERSVKTSRKSQG